MTYLKLYFKSDEEIHILKSDEERISAGGQKVTYVGFSDDVMVIADGNDDGYGKVQKKEDTIIGRRAEGVWDEN